MKPTLLLAIAVFCSASVQAATETTLHCAQLFDSRAGRMLGPHTVVVKDGKIASVTATTPAAEATASALALPVCLPGLTDLHVHLGGESSPQSYAEGFRLDPVDYAFRAVGYAEKTLLAGFTSVRDLGGDIALSLRNATAQGLVRGPRIFAAGKLIATTGGHGDPRNGINSELAHLYGPSGPTEGVVNSVDEARQAVRQRYKEGSDLIKITATGGVLSYASSGDAPQFTQEEIASVVATANDYGFKVAAHAHGKEGIKRAILGGVTSIEHGTYMDDELFRLMKQKGTWYVPTIYAGRFVADKAKIDGYFPEVVRPKAARIGALIQGTFGRAYRAGVRIGFGTDMGVGPHGDNAQEFVYMVEAGMPAAAALQSATFNAAQVLGVTDQGEIAIGMRADIIAVSTDPIADIAAMKQVDFVMKDGVVHKRHGALVAN